MALDKAKEIELPQINLSPGNTEEVKDEDDDEFAKNISKND